MHGSPSSKSVVQKQIFVLSFSGKSRQKCVRVVRKYTSRNSAPDPPDPPETQHPVQNRPWVPRAGGQDYGSLHTNSLKSAEAPANIFYSRGWHRKRNMRCGTDPGFPTPGARMTVVKQTPSNNGEPWFTMINILYIET